MLENKREFTPGELLMNILVYPGNLKLLEQIDNAIEQSNVLNTVKIKLNEGATIEDARTVLINAIFEETFTIFQIIYLYHNKPFEVIKYIKGFFKRWELSLAKLHLHLLKIAIKDDKRFDFKSPGLEYINIQIDKIDINKVHSDRKIESYTAWIDFFNKGAGQPMEPFMKAYFQVRGLLKSKSEIVKEFISENRDIIKNELELEILIGKIKNGTEINSKVPQENISWVNKTELCELIYSLSKSNRILKNGKPISESDLIKLFEKIFNIDLNRYHNLLNSGFSANKKTIDESFFTKELFDHVKNWKPKRI